MSEKSNRSNGGIVIRIVFAAILIISGLSGISKVLSKNDIKDIDIPTVMLNEFAADKNGVEFCVTNVDNQKSVGSDYLEVTTEYNFVVVTIKIANNSSEPYDVNSLRFVLMNGETEYEYATDTIMSLDNALTLDTVNPGITKEYNIAYETPVTTDDSEFVLKIKDNAVLEDDCVYITLKDSK